MKNHYFFNYNNYYFCIDFEKKKQKKRVKILEINNNFVVRLYDKHKNNHQLYLKTNKK